MQLHDLCVKATISMVVSEAVAHLPSWIFRPQKRSGLYKISMLAASKGTHYQFGPDWVRQKVANHCKDENASKQDTNGRLHAGLNFGTGSAVSKFAGYIAISEVLVFCATT